MPLKYLTNISGVKHCQFYLRLTELMAGQNIYENPPKLVLDFVIRSGSPPFKPGTGDESKYKNRVAKRTNKKYNARTHTHTLKTIQI